MSKTISILGCGWLGTAIGTALITEGYTVKGSGRTDDRLKKIKEAGIKAYRFHVDGENTEDFNDFFDCDVVLIAIPPSKMDDDSLDNFLAQIPDNRIKQAILISSTGIYKDCNQIVKENTKEIKVEGRLYEIEGSVKRRFRNRTTVLRPGGLIGPGRDPANFMTSEKVLENPRGHINLVHQEDCIKIISKLIALEKTNVTYNLVMDDHPTKKEFYSSVAFMKGKKEPNFAASHKRYYKIVSNEKIKRDLDYTFIDIFDAVRMF